MATEADLQRLIDNDERLTTLILTFDYTLNVDQLRQALSRNNKVSEVVVYIDETFLPGRNVRQLQLFFAALGSMQSLQKLCFNSRSGFDGLLSVDACLSPVLSATQLVSFAISDLKLSGSLSDWARFAEQLQRLYFLKSFCIMECELLVTDDGDNNQDGDEEANDDDVGGDEQAQRRFLHAADGAAPQQRRLEEADAIVINEVVPVDAANAAVIAPPVIIPEQDEGEMHAAADDDDDLQQNEPQRTYPLEPVLMVLSILPSLEIIYLHSTAGQGLGDVSARAVGALCLSASVRVLKLRDFDFTQDHLATIALMLKANPRLKDLKIGTLTQFDPTAARAMGNLLQTNATLECLELGLSHMITDECASIMAYALQRNKCLKMFALAKDGVHRNQLNGINNVADAETEAAAAAADDGKITERCHQVFVDALRGNYTLETFVLFERFPVKPEIKLYVTLNKFGRGKLMKDDSKANAGEWLKAIARVSHDLDAIYYYISINPELCGEAPSSSSPAPSDTTLAAVADPPAQHASSEFLARIVGMPTAAFAPGSVVVTSQVVAKRNRRRHAEPSGRYDQEPAVPGFNKRPRHGP